MSNRTVKVTLTAQVSGYLASMEAAAKGTKKTTQTLEQQKTASLAAAQAQGQAFTSLGVTGVRMGVIAATGLAVAIARFADFDKALSNVKAATQETTENMDLLRDAALDAGATTVFTASEAANAIEELGKNGLTTAQILDGGLSGALALATSGQLDVARAAEVAAITMKQFGLAGGDIPHIADLLAAGAGKAAGDVEDLAQALAQGGLVANQTGLSIEETAGTLAAFADKGLIGSDAGTAFKTMLQSLTPSSKEAAKKMDELGISAFDASGEFIGISKFAGVYQNALKSQSTQQQAATAKLIFGSDAVRAASVLYDLGADGIQRYVDQTNDSGYAAKVAADRLDNLAGDVEKLGGSFDTALIKNGSVANDTMRSLTQSLTYLVDGASALPEPLQATGLVMGAVASATLLAGGAALQVVPKWAALKATVEASGTSFKGIAANSLKAGGAIGIASLALGILIQTAADSASRVDELAESLDQTTGAVTDYTRELAAKQLQETKAFDQAKNLGISLDLVTDAALNGGDAMKELEKQATAAAEGNFILSAQSRDLQYVTNRVNGEIEQGVNKNRDAAKATRENAGATESSADAYSDAASQAASFSSELNTLIDTINKANGLNQDSASANAAYQRALAETNEAVDAYVKKNGQSTVAVKENTLAGTENLDMLGGLAEAAQNAAQAAVDAGGGAEAYQAALAAGNQKIYDTTLALTGNADKAKEVADRFAAIPTMKQSRLVVDSANAVRNLDTVLDRMGRIRSIASRVNVNIGKVANGINLDGLKAGGGAIHGPGGPKDDKAGIFGLSNGEHVLTASDVQALGGQAGVYSMRAALQAGSPYATAAAPVYASGGSGATIVNNYSIPVTVSSMAVDNPDAVGRAVAAGVRTALRNGVIPADWNKA